jgi:hypothetical protein
MIFKFVSSGERMTWLFGITGMLTILQRTLSLSMVLICRFDYHDARAGNRVVSLGEKPYFDPASKSKAEALA